MAQIINNLQDIAHNYDHFILDIFGVLHDGIRPFEDTVRTLSAMKGAGKQICLLSNSPRRAKNAAAQMISMGIGRHLYDEIVTSGEATYDYLKNTRPPEHKNCWFIGTAYVAEVVEGQDINLLDDPQNADFILNTIPGTESSTIKRLKENLVLALDKDLPMICANPDLVVHIGDELYECAGTFAKIYEDMGGRVIYHGKPHAPVYERSYELLGNPDKARICAIGDSLHTDIAGANNFGIDSALNLAGIHREEITEGTFTHLDEQPHRPTYLINGFSW